MAMADGDMAQEGRITIMDTVAGTDPFIVCTIALAGRILLIMGPQEPSATCSRVSITMRGAGTGAHTGSAVVSGEGQGRLILPRPRWMA